MKARPAARGQSLVEFALVLPLIVLLLIGVLDLGRAVYAFTTLAEAARQANRLAIVDQDIARVQNEAVAYAPALGLSTADVDVCFKTSGSQERNCDSPSADPCVSSGTYQQLSCLAIVVTSTQFTPITPLVSALVPSVTLTSASVGTIENACPSTLRPTVCP